MTHGGFCKHFATKDDMLAVAITAAFDDFVEGLQAGGSSPRTFDKFIATYLRRDHVEHPEEGCPIAALGAETSRLGEVAAEASAKGIERVVDAMAGLVGGPKATARERAQYLLATLVGAMIIARASGDADLARSTLANAGEISKGAADWFDAFIQSPLLRIVLSPTAWAWLPACGGRYTLRP